MLLLLLMLMLKLKLIQQSGDPAVLWLCRTLRRFGRAGGTCGAALKGGIAFAAAAARSAGVFGLAFTGMVAMLGPQHAGNKMM